MKGLILIYIITAIGTLGALRNPKIGLFVYVGFAVLRPQGIWGWAGDMDGISRVLGIATLLSWGLHGFGKWHIGRGRFVVVALLTFTAWSTLSAFQATDSNIAFGAIYELLKIVLPLLVGVTVLESEADLRTMLWTIVLAQGYAAFELNWSYLLKGYNAAAEGFAGMDNNCLGAALVTVIGPAVTLAVASRKWWQKGLAALAAALLLHATLLTFSRGALIGLMSVGLTAMLILPKRPAYIGAIVLVGLLAIRLTGPQLEARYATAFASSDEGGDQGEGRLDLWKDCLTVVNSAPLFGVGPWNWRIVAASFGWPEGKSAHSVWMETAAETGYPGVLALAWFFVWGAAKLWPLARAKVTASNRYNVIVAAGIMLSIVGFVISGQFVSVTGLEVPYYITMVGIVMLKLCPRDALEKVAVAAHSGRSRISMNKQRSSFAAQS